MGDVQDELEPIIEGLRGDLDDTMSEKPGGEGHRRERSDAR